MAHDVCVAGGGIAGLSCALRLSSAGLDVVVLEEKDAPGGNIRTAADGPYRTEYGPHTFMGSADDVFALAEEAGVAGEIIPSSPAASARFIVRDGRLHKVPTGLVSFLSTGLLGFGAKMRLATEPFRTVRGLPGDTAMQFFKRRFGEEAARVLAGAFISGVYAGDPDALSAPAAFPLFWKFEQESGGMIRGAMKHARERKAAGRPARKGLFTLKGGLGTLSRAAAAKLGGRVRTGSAAEYIGFSGRAWTVAAGGTEFKSRCLVLAVPPLEAAGLLKSTDAGTASLAEGIPLAPVAVAHFGYAERADCVPDGFGFLAPRDAGIRCLGVLFPSRLFDDRAPEGGDLFTAFLGGVKDPGALELSDGELLDAALSDMKKLTGLDMPPDFLKVSRVPRAIPQLTLGHLDRIAGIKGRLENLPGLFLAGNWLKGVGMKDAVSSGFEAAALAAAFLKGRES